MKEADALFRHSVNMYDALKKGAKKNDDGILEFRGSLFKVYASISASQTYYSNVFFVLERLGCIARVSRGNSLDPSIVLIYHPPKLNEYNTITDEIRDRKPLTKFGQAAILAQRLTDQFDRLGGTDIVESLVETLEKLEELETRVEKLEKRDRRVKSNGSQKKRSK